MVDLKSKIREIPDWPKPGINFKDITTLLQDKAAFKQAVDSLAQNFAGQQIDKVVGIDARGFLIAAPLAYQLQAGLAIVRKPGKLPFTTIEQEYTLEYASNILEMHDDAIAAGEKILLIDDLIATGGTAEATCDLIEKLGGQIVGAGFLIELSFLPGAQKLRDRGIPIISLIKYDHE
ncbi:MAG: adenine phosphoribosyltransferase [Patescibacteria group bacterium]|nr:adenine phosphoribosyltransferase [Patescibacteria group bacterium]